MDSNNIRNKEIYLPKKIKLQNKLKKIGSKYILQKIFGIMKLNKSLKIIKINKSLQQRLDININNYKEYPEIAIEIIPVQNIYGNFININNKEDEKYYHIYFNEDKEEIKRTYLDENDEISKINIIIDYPIKSF